jgi:hypothetical protein
VEQFGEGTVAVGRVLQGHGQVPRLVCCRPSYTALSTAKGDVL